MRQSTFRWVVGELQSAAARTSLVLWHDNIEVRLGRRCSPYRSHQVVDFVPDVDADGLSWGCLVLAARDDARLVIVTHDTLSLPEDPAELLTQFWGKGHDIAHFEAEAVQVPSRLVGGLLDLLHSETGGFIPRLPGTGSGRLIRLVAIRRRVVGWHEDGHPIFSGREPDCLIAPAEQTV